MLPNQEGHGCQSVQPARARGEGESSHEVCGAPLGRGPRNETSASPTVCPTVDTKSVNDSITVPLRPALSGTSVSAALAFSLAAASAASALAAAPTSTAAANTLRTIAADPSAAAASNDICSATWFAVSCSASSTARVAAANTASILRIASDPLRALASDTTPYSTLRFLISTALSAATRSATTFSVAAASALRTIAVEPSATAAAHPSSSAEPDGSCRSIA
mmetsp:Transcript_51488/g.115655  ORF Transcript_51488/g.115655 Transcript_51488/m.115655 type:complete len:222 (+) Transcript_51488:387-1052(+)|eukprot:CAMPEP_0181205184 /NCGR_PEP_ID=MMETSP1096-20121128/20331_1 /TAXON_ID=156174 ORGANISM="Chrysochromulina ericina, Strain CCMP281" /NCGR_SAMPLE_ID=MMETSP1096 /ASSEMBLY_ACC=CAM_ASM_000453 /LENGTH=221 /DNA_ID=CAMNT_0023295929 /DNA_START=387 /DNA_END=1052 /DNA_ORIENTATION=+